MYVGISGGGVVPLVLLSTENAEDYCLGWIGCDRGCFLRNGMCDLENHGRQKL
jgi:hypothetical protein